MNLLRPRLYLPYNALFRFPFIQIESIHLQNQIKWKNNKTQTKREEEDLIQFKTYFFLHKDCGSVPVQFDMYKVREWKIYE